MIKPKQRKAIWFKATRKPDRKAAYYRKVKKWLSGRVCCVCNDASKEVEVHHSKGRLSSLLMDERWFIPLCRKDHSWVHNNMDLARAIEVCVDGVYIPLLCAKGEWNKQ